jgi:RNA recognition motif-containing protein
VNIYVGNLPREANETDLQEAFQPFGQVTSVTIIKDKFSGESRGFGFVEMPSKAEAQAAITGMEGKELKGRTLSVNEARPRPEGRGGGRGDRGGGGRRTGGGGGRYSR